MIFNQLKFYQSSLAEWLFDLLMQFIIYPSVWVAAAIASLGIFTQEVLELGHNEQAIALIFVTAIIPYNLDRIFDSYVQKIPDSKAQLFFRQPYIWFLLLSAIVATAILLYLAPYQVRYASIVGIVPLLYGSPLFPWKRNSQWQWYRLKDIPGSKAWIVGSILTYAVIVLPLAYAEAEFNSVAAITTLFMFVFIVTNSHIFDVRDLQSDREKGVVTLPIMLGVRGSKIFLATMNLLMLCCLIVAWYAEIINYYPEMILATAVNLVYIWKVDTDTPRWVYSISIEGFLFVPLLANWIKQTVI